LRQSAIEMLRAGRDPQELARELGVRVPTLRVWLLAAEGGSHRPGRGRDQVISRTVQAYERLEQALSSVPESVLETPLPFGPGAIDSWRVVDALAHVAHYKARTVRRLTTRGGARGLSRSPVERDIEEYWHPEEEYWHPEYWARLEASDPVLAKMEPRTRRRHGPNHLVYQRWRHHSAGEILAWQRLVHEYVVWWLANGPEAWFRPETPTTSPELSHAASSALGRHSDVHLRDILRTLSAAR
jgi:hypothetical protein